MMIGQSQRFLSCGARSTQWQPGSRELAVSIIASANLGAISPIYLVPRIRTGSFTRFSRGGRGRRHGRSSHNRSRGSARADDVERHCSEIEVDADWNADSEDISPVVVGPPQLWSPNQPRPPTPT